MPTDPNKQRVAIRYHSDDGNFYSIVTSRNHAIAVGATAAQAGDPPLPTKWKPRKLHGLQIQAGNDRTLGLVIPERTSALWLGTNNVITVPPYGAMEVTGRTGERRTQGAPGFDGNANPPNERVSIRYRSENGQDYSIVTTRAHAAAIAAESGQAYPAYPEIWTPRHYNLASPNKAGRDQKMRLIEGNPAAASWVSDAQYRFTINGQIFDTTGRTHEDRPRGAPPYTP